MFLISSVGVVSCTDAFLRTKLLSNVVQCLATERDLMTLMLLCSHGNQTWWMKRYCSLVCTQPARSCRSVLTILRTSILEWPWLTEII